MRARRLAADILVAVGVQGLAFLVSAVSAFIVPKVMPVESFGYWQLFLFYVGYLGYLQGGLSDGAYLRYGGILRKDIGSTGASAHFWVLLVGQLLIGVCLLVAGLLSLGLGRGEVFVALGIMLPAFSAKRFLGYIFQAMGETRRFSLSLFVSSVAFALPLLALVVSHVRQPVPYLVAYVAAEYVGVAYCLAYARGVIVAPPNHLRLALSDAWSSIKVGIRLLVATSAGALILGVSRIVIDARWNIATFAQVSLAVTFVGFVVTLMAQVSLVLYPALRMTSEASRVAALLNIRTIAIALLPLGYLIYYPAALILLAWLPGYAQGIRAAILLMPMCVFDGLMQVLYGTYFKVVRRERSLMYVNLGAVAIAALGSLVGGYWWGSIEVVLLSSAVAAAVRAVVSDGLLRPELGVPWRGSAEVNVVLGGLFVWSAWNLPMSESCLLMCAALVGSLAWRSGALVASIRAVRGAMSA